MAEVSNSSTTDSAVYRNRREQIAHYFDNTAMEHWRRLTSDVKVSRVRQSVRAGRETMQQQLLAWLPDDLRGQRVLDAGCGTGVLAAQLAARGASVVGIDLSPQLIAIAREQRPAQFGDDRLLYLSGDMLDPSVGEFDYIVAMDSLIHYALPETMQAVAELTERCHRGLCFTFVPRTPLLAIMHATGQLFPSDNRSPDVTPTPPVKVRQAIAATLGTDSWRLADEARVDSFFYKSHALRLERTGS
ncbi:MAG: magnesium protoporphyrin IX methyltransferase [Pseudomonadota bacterium]